MARRRFFVDAIHKGMAELRGEEARHLTRVLRAEPGQRYEISDKSGAYLAEIVEARGDLAVFRVVEPAASAALPVRITLCAALIKFDRFEWLVEKATELAAEQILPVGSARSEKGLLEASHKRSRRWERIAHESGQQARRLAPPAILPAVSFERSLALEADYRYFLEEAVAPPLMGALPVRRLDSDRVALLVGPEGGWTDAERSLAAEAGWSPVSLGPLVLRAETASLAALSVIGSAWMA